MCSTKRYANICQQGWRYERTTLERDATQALADFDRDRTVSVAVGIASAVLISTGVAVLYWPRSPARAASVRTRVAFTGSGFTLMGDFR